MMETTFLALLVPLALSSGSGGSANLSTVISSIGSVFTAAMGWVGDVASTVSSEPLLLIGVVISFIGVGIGLFSRLLHV